MKHTLSIVAGFLQKMDKKKEWNRFNISFYGVRFKICKMSYDARFLFRIFNRSKNGVSYLPLILSHANSAQAESTRFNPSRLETLSTFNGLKTFEHRQVVPPSFCPPEVVLSLRQAEIMQSCDYQLTNVFVSKPFCLKLLEPNI